MGENISINYTDVGGNNEIFYLQDDIKEQIYILLEAMIVFLNPPSENLSNGLSNKNQHNIR